MGWLLLIPFFLIRFGLLSVLSRGAVLRAARFPSMTGRETVAYWIYQFSTAAIVVCILFLPLSTVPWALFCTGITVYAVGSLLLAAAVVSFAAPSENGLCQGGLYRLSRNPIYMAYFFVFIGCTLLTRSMLLLGLVLCFQVSAHWIIRAEERWCIGRFGTAYLQYMEQVRRYF